MAESMVGLKRSHRCTEVTSAQIGEKVTVMGWVQKSRNKGGIIFVDLRDRSGILQIIFEENDCGTENFEKAEKLRSEFVIAVEGRVEARSGAVNENLATGAIEVEQSPYVSWLSLRLLLSQLKKRARQKKICVWNTVSWIFAVLTSRET